MNQPTLAAAIQAAAREVPDRTALTLLSNRAPDQAIRYGELYAGAQHWAQALATAGVAPGEVCILILNHGPELPLSYFGTVLRGAIPAIMPFLTEKLAPEQYRASLAALLEITRPAAVITYPDFVSEIHNAVSGIEQCSLRVILTAGDQPEGNPGTYPDAVPARAVHDPDLSVPLALGHEILAGLSRSPEEVAILQHSSGTTGLQKGVALSHRAVFNQLESYSRAIRLSPDDCIVSWLPLYHDMGLIAGYLLPLLSRIPLVLMSPFDWVRAPYRLLQAVSRFQGTLTWLPNFAYNFLAQKVRDRDLEDVDLSTWRAVINCSEPMHVGSHAVFLERYAPYGLRPEALATCYAMAENVFAVTQGGIASPVVVDEVDLHALVSSQKARPASGVQGTVKMLSAGRPIDGVQVRILGQDGQTLPDRSIGEIAVRSHCMLTGYFHRPDLTEKAFLDGWYLTGDLGYQAGGELYVTGRKKDLIIVGGKNVYPQDLERIAGSVPGVHPGRVAAFGVFNEAAGTEEVVLLAESDEPEAAYPEIADSVRQKVTQGSDIALRRVEILPRGWLLKTSSGKVARSANREKYLTALRVENSFSDRA